MFRRLAAALDRRLHALPLRSRSLLFAFALALAAGTILFAFPGNAVSAFYLAAGSALAALVYGVVPVTHLIAVFGDGEAGGVLLVMACAIVTWTVAFWIATYALLKLRAIRRRRPAVPESAR